MNGIVDNILLDKTIPINPSTNVMIDLNIVESILKVNCTDNNISKIINDRINILTNGLINIDKYIFSYAETRIDNNSLNRNLYYSGSEIFSILSIIAGYDHISYSFDILDKKIEELSNIESEEDLDKINNNYFINLYNNNRNWYAIIKNSEYYRNKDYNIFKNKMSMDFIISRIRTAALRMGMNMDNIDIEKLYKEYINEKKEFTLKGFVKDYISSYYAIRDNVTELSEIISNPIDINFEPSEKNIEKLDFYIAIEYMRAFKNVTSQNDKQIYLYYLSNYFEKYKDRMDKIKIFDKVNNKIYYMKDLYNHYLMELKNNPNLRIIDFKKDDFTNMTESESKEFMDEYLKDISANWKFLEGASDYLSKEELDKIKKNIDSIGDSDKKRALLENLNLFLEKKKYFDSSDPFYRIQGLNSFDGYLGFIYPNGKVILEKFFENKDKGIIAKNQAIYCMNIIDFYQISRNSKTAIIANNLCKRYIHKGDWQEKVSNEINSKTQIYTAKELEKMLESGLINK